MPGMGGVMPPMAPVMPMASMAPVGPVGYPPVGGPAYGAFEPGFGVGYGAAPPHF